MHAYAIPTCMHACMHMPADLQCVHFRTHEIDPDGLPQVRFGIGVEFIPPIRSMHAMIGILLILINMVSERSFFF
jgi:hypothetical protein